MTTVLIVAALGLFVGLSLGTLGGGGSTLAVPILVFVAGLEAQEATTASLLVVGAAATIGVVGHYRNGNVRLGAGIAFGLAGIAGSSLGTEMNRALDENVLLLGFSVLILLVAILMYHSVRPDRRKDTWTRSQPIPEASGRSTITAIRQRTMTDLSAGAVAKLAGAATVVGLLTGLFGVGGGFAVVPALTLLLGFDAKQAIGTSLVVIAINAAIALGMRSADLSIDASVVGPFLLTVTLGVVAGSRVADRLEAERLTRVFAVMLAAVAVYTAAGTLLI